MSHFSEDEERKLRALFEDFDVDRSGHLNARELRRFAQCYGVCPTEEEIDNALRLRDRNRDNALDFEEVKDVLFSIVKHQEKIQEEMERAMETLLTCAGYRKNEQLNKFQFYDLQKNKGEDPLTMQEVDEIFADLDKFDNSDTASKEEIARLFSL